MILQLIIVLLALCWFTLWKFGFRCHLRHRTCYFGIRFRNETRNPTDRCHLHHHRSCDMCWYHASIRRYGLVNTAGRKTTSKEAWSYHISSTTLYLLPDGICGNRTRSIYSYAYHLRHCAQERNTSRASLRCSIYRLSGRYNLFANCCRCRSVCEYIQRKRFQHLHPRCADDFHSFLSLWTDSSCICQLSSRT